VFALAIKQERPRTSPTAQNFQAVGTNYHQTAIVAAAVSSVLIPGPESVPVSANVQEKIDQFH
jgi:hypothetical protein